MRKAKGNLGSHSHSLTGILNELPVKDVSFALTCSSTCAQYPWVVSLRILILVCQGCLKPVQITIPKGCLLDPSDTAAVVGGNVLTSQRVVDVVLRAFAVCAASQVCYVYSFPISDSSIV